MVNTGSFIFSLLSLVIVLVASWKILTKAGFSGYWCVVMAIPVVNLLGMLYFAFTEWPVEKSLKPPVETETPEG